MFQWTQQRTREDLDDGVETVGQTLSADPGRFGAVTGDDGLGHTKLLLGGRPDDLGT
jgi:hypothetical protein